MPKFGVNMHKTFAEIQTSLQPSLEKRFISDIRITWIDASTRSRGFCTQSSQRFSFEPVLEFALEFPLLP